jgi:hypothetical protein
MTKLVESRVWAILCPKLKLPGYRNRVLLEKGATRRRKKSPKSGIGEAGSGMGQ